MGMFYVYSYFGDSGRQYGQLLPNYLLECEECSLVSAREHTKGWGLFSPNPILVDMWGIITIVQPASILCPDCARFGGTQQRVEGPPINPTEEVRRELTGRIMAAYEQLSAEWT